MSNKPDPFEGDEHALFSTNGLTSESLEAGASSPVIHIGQWQLSPSQSLALSQYWLFNPPIQSALYAQSQIYAELGDVSPSQDDVIELADEQFDEQFLIQFNTQSDAALWFDLLSHVGAKEMTYIGDPAEGLILFSLATGPNQAQSLDALKQDQSVYFLEPNVVVMADAISNDPDYTNGKSWGMYGNQTSPANIYGSQAGEAWAAGHTGSSTTVVGIIDTGMDYTHQDLYLNAWINQKEITASLRSHLQDVNSDGVISFWDLNSASNAAWVSDGNANGYIDGYDLLSDSRWADGADTDLNGYSDDLLGWDFVNNDNNPFDDNLHGTHVAGIIGAVGGNSLGVAGVNWNIEMMAIKFLGANGSGFLSNAILAINYFTQMSMNSSGTNQNFIATNNSWGGGSFDQVLNNAIINLAKADALFVAAAGNSALNNDGSANYPSNYTTTSGAGYDSVIAVAALTSTGALASFSNYGKVSVDLAAPGDTIYSTLPGNSYGNLSGTSMATPFVTGALALYAAEHPTDTALSLKTTLLNSTNPLANLSQSVVTGGALDVSQLMNASAPLLNNFYYGTYGVDSLIGAAGNDYFEGSLGADFVDGKDGSDIYSITTLADYALGEVIQDSGNGAGSDELRVALSTTASFSVFSTTTGIERIVIGTGAASAAVTTATFAIDVSAMDLVNAVSMIGNAGANKLTGSNFADTLNGGLGNDTLIGGAGNDLLTGGAGIDTASYESASAALNINLVTGVVTSLVAGGAGSDTITISTGNEIENIIASAYNDTIIGSALANLLDGGTGDDTLDGGLGNDTLIGGAGNDLLTGGAGIDTASYESASAALNINLVTGVVTSLVAGGAGSDTITISTGNEIENIIASAYNDTIIGSALANLLDGGTGDDTLDGGLGNDTLIGGAGNDLLTGGAGIDTFTISSGTDSIADLGNGGADILIVANGASVEALVTSAWTATTATTNSGRAAILKTNGLVVNLGSAAGVVGFSLTNTGLATTLTGSAQADTLIGGVGNDTLNGGAGNDSLIGGSGTDSLGGGAGNDTYVVNLTSAGALEDTITEAANAGTDTVQLAGSYAGALVTLSLATNLENLDASATGTSLLNLTGNAAANILTGNAAANTLSGGTGADTMIGGAGNDTYAVDNVGDVVTELVGGGTDLVQSSVTYTLAANVDSLTLTGTVAINGTGNADNNSLKGNTAANSLFGGAGDDTLDGGAGNDSLTGGAGADVFIFSSVLSSGTTSNRDTITDFAIGVDKIQLSKTIFTTLGPLGNLNINEFYAAPTANTGADASDRIVYNTTSGALYYDSDGNGNGAAVQIALIGTSSHPTLSYADFQIIA